MSGEPAPTLSVLIASYGAEAFIARAIDAVLASTLRDLEVIVVDDVSPDDSAAIVARIVAADPRVTLVRLAANGGPAAARNRAIAEARGRWLAVVDSDDLVAPDRFATLVTQAEAAGVDMIADDLLVFQDGRPGEATRFLSAADRRAGGVVLDLATYLRRSVHYGPEPNPGFLKPLIRRDRLVATGVRYDERLRIAEDDDLMIRLLLAGCTYRVTARPGYFYRKHDGSISHRLTTRALAAMMTADEEVAGRVTAARPDLAQVARARTRSYRRAFAFETMIEALKAGRPVRAIAAAVRHPSIVPLLGMPAAGILRRLRPAAPPPRVAPDAELAALIARRAVLLRS